MKKIMVLGPGCPRCETLAKLTREAADDIGIEYEFEKVTDVVDGELKIQGKVPALDEIKSMLA